jgi:hypothetical protein
LLSQVTADLKALQDQLLLPQNVRVHVSCDVSKLSMRGPPIAPWKTFITDLNMGAGDG